MDTRTTSAPLTKSISIPVGPIRLEGELELPENATGLVLFAHGSGSSRPSPTNQLVARAVLQTTKQVVGVPGATHLFEEPGALQEVSRLAASWFGRHLR